MLLLIQYCIKELKDKPPLDAPDDGFHKEDYTPFSYQVLTSFSSDISFPSYSSLPSAHTRGDPKWESILACKGGIRRWLMRYAGKWKVLGGDCSCRGPISRLLPPPFKLAVPFFIIVSYS
ncbi:unnamed protein product [Nezara viridula]|uniref:Uncharacterized protein n=1 Tax=Nezara viridula TaxID=85310 RepID=A0A9P0MQD3_NEZVI|nr:unnamed protein product [Nezara viridula]